MSEQTPPLDERLDARKTDSRILGAYIELIAENARRLDSHRTDFGDQLHRIEGRLITLEMHVNHGFDRMDWRFEQIDRRFEQLDRRFGEMEKNLSGVALELSRLSGAVSRLSAHLGIRATPPG